MGSLTMAKSLATTMLIKDTAVSSEIVVRVAGTAELAPERAVASVPQDTDASTAPRTHDGSLIGLLQQPGSAALVADDAADDDEARG
jgi:hypothetical protein